MENDTNYTLVGLFVIILTTCLVLAIIWLSSGFSLNGSQDYMVLMKESVAGLSPDSTVEYNGVSVGSVKTITLSKKNPELVQVVLTVKGGTPITRGTLATLNAKGLTGITYLALKDKGDDLRPLEKVGDMPYPVIPTAPSIFVRLDTALSMLNQHLQSVAQSVQAVLNKDNLTSIHATLVNLENVSKNLSDNNKRFNLILQNTMQATKQLTPFVQSSVNTMRILETQTLPSTYRLLQNLDDATQTFSEIARDIKQNPSILIRGTGIQPLGPGESR